MNKELWITTEDNPFDYFTETDRWINYDYQMGYDTCGKVARLAHCSNNLTQFENEERITAAVLDLLELPGGTLSRDGTQWIKYVPAIKGQTVSWFSQKKQM